MQQSSLNLIPSGDMPIIYASQYDKNRVIRFNLFEGEDEYTLTGTEIVKCNIRKNDEHIVVITPTIGANKYIDVYLTEQACACFGDNIGEITISSGEDNIIGTINFILKVERNPIQGGVTSETDIDDLTDQIEDIVHEVMSDDYYTKSEVDAALNLKANAADVYTKSEVDTALGLKADKADTYTKTQVDTALASKADITSVYTKSEVDTALSLKANADDVYTKTEVDEMIDDLYPVNTASGSIANFTTSLAKPLTELTSTIVAQQAGTGTPSPSNPRSISGVSSVSLYQRGVNFWDEEWEVGAIDADGNNVENNSRIRSKNYISVVPSKTYYIKTPKGIWIWGYNYEKTFVARIPSTASSANTTITIPPDVYYIRFVVVDAYGTTYNNDIAILYPSTQTEYVPYNPQSETKTIALGQTVYGGSVDAKNGNASKTFDIADFSNLVKNSASATNWVYYSRQPNFNVDRSLETLCSHFPRGGLSTPATWINSNTIIYFNLDGVIDTNDVATAKAYLANVQFVYPLATPTEITGLTPANFTTFAGEQNIFADSGDVSVSFKQGIQEYIDNKVGG